MSADGRKTPSSDSAASTGSRPVTPVGGGGGGAASNGQQRPSSRNSNFNPTFQPLSSAPANTTSQLSTSLSDKSVKKKASYGALRAASSHHNAILGTSMGSNTSGSSSRRGSAILTGNQGSTPAFSSSYGSSLPRAIPGANVPGGGLSGSYRRPMFEDGVGGSSFVGPSSFKNFSPGRPLAGALDRQNSPSPAVEEIGEREAAMIVSEHLVDPSDEDSASPPKVFGSVSHSLLGGAMTRDIYQWKEKRLSPAPRRRRNSESDLSSRRSPDLITASDLQQPGMFRRQFISQRAERQGREANIITRNFIDFLLLFGYYGGDVLPEEYDDEDYDDLEQVSGPRLPGAEGGVGAGGEGQETTPLLGSGNRNSMNRPTTNSRVQGTSAKKAFFMLMKAFVGTGVLFLPKAFSNGGMGFSVILLLFIGWLTLHCMLLLVETSRALGGSFGDIGEKLYGPGVRQLVLWSIAVSQAGFSCAYFIFVAQNLRDLVMIVSDCKLVYPEYVFMIVQLLIYVPLSWVRRIKHFSIPSLVADVFILMGLGYIFYYNLSVLATSGVAQDFVWVNLQSFSLFVGTAMFAFEGICLILPIAESMKKPEEFGWVLTLCVVVIGAIFVIIGATGYLAFGAKVETVVFLNLPKGSKLVMGLQFFYAIAIMLSFPLTVYPSIRIIEAGLFGVLDGKKSTIVKWQKNAFRAFFVSALAWIAWAGSNNLDKFVSLIKDMAIVVFGIIALFYTTYVTIEQWIVGNPDVPADRCMGAIHP
ncbi:neutral amino acid transporter [Phlyctochytrium planicorne]|nr:neutral amino acid transporter [Phlyctochytrium planicorne]